MLNNNHINHIETETHLKYKSFINDTTKFGFRPEPPHMRISHKWSHTETILQAQSQSHNLTYSYKILGSYPPGSAYPSHIFILFHVTTTGTIP